MAKQNEKSAEKQTQKKWLALGTYAFALVCLLAGLLIPFGGTGAIKDGFKADNMLVMQLFTAMNTLFGTKLKFAPETFIFSHTSDLFGLLGAGKTFDLGAVFCLIYAVVVVAALIGLIPVIASKKTSETALKTASVIEVIAGVVLTAFMVINLCGFLGLTSLEGRNFNYAILIAFGGVLLALIIQSIGYKKGSGVIKTILALLSGIVLFFLIFPLTGYSTKFAEAWLKGKLGTGLYSMNKMGSDGAGIVYITMFFCMFAGYKELYKTAPAAADKTVLILVTIIAFLAIVNFMLDLAGLGKKTKRYMIISNVVRYGLQLAAVLALLITVAVTKSYGLEILMYVLIGIAAIQLVINIIRIFTYKKQNVSAEDAKAAKAEKAARKAEKAAAKEARKAEKAALEAEKAEKKRAAVEEETAVYAVEEQPAVYEVKAIYDGPVDEFIKKLTTAERIEFANAFIEHNIILPNVPDYVVGGKNDKFFTSVFIYYSRIRERISDSLLNKIYAQGNLMY